MRQDSLRQIALVSSALLALVLGACGGSAPDLNNSAFGTDAGTGFGYSDTSGSAGNFGWTGATDATFTSSDAGSGAALDSGSSITDELNALLGTGGDGPDGPAGGTDLTAGQDLMAALDDLLGRTSGACWNNSGCGQGEYCEFEAGVCAHNRPGVCRTKPSGCGAGGAAVCGCDAKNYDNACAAAVAGVSVWMDGRCPKTCGGAVDDGSSLLAQIAALTGANVGYDAATEANAECGSGNYCAFETECGFGFRGTCSARPKVCPSSSAQVCGCDGNTYSNSCEASKAGVSVTASGACTNQHACESIDRSYQLEVSKARQCSASSSLAQCTLKLADRLICPCDTYAEAGNSVALAAIARLQLQFEVMGCQANSGCNRTCATPVRGCNATDGAGTGLCRR